MRNAASQSVGPGRNRGRQKGAGPRGNETNYSGRGERKEIQEAGKGSSRSYISDLRRLGEEAIKASSLQGDNQSVCGPERGGIGCKQQKQVAKVRKNPKACF